jgi:hypothetical protein
MGAFTHPVAYFLGGAKDIADKNVVISLHAIKFLLSIAVI